MEPEFALCEIAKGEVALCLRTGDKLEIIREHMTANEAIIMFKDVISGKITSEQLVNNYQWRTISIRDVEFTGMERIELPSIDKWRK